MNPKTKLNINTNLFLFLNIETNGLPKTKKGLDKYYHYSDLAKYNSSRIIRIAWVIYDYNQKFVCEKDFLIKPKKFNIYNSYIHGITKENALQNGIRIKKAFNKLQKDIKNVKFIIGHNLPFTMNIVLSEMYRLNLHELINEMLKKTQTCTAKKTIHVLKIPFMSSGYKMPSLPELYKYCFNKKMTNHHNSLSDAKNIAKCFFFLLKN